MATSSNWKAPIIVVAVVATLSLGVLAASLVKLGGNFGSTPAPTTVTVTAAPAVVTPTATTAAPPASTPTTAAPTGSTTSPVPASPGTATSGPKPGTPAEKAHLRTENEERRRRLGK
jgi:hypothetical protein